MSVNFDSLHGAMESGRACRSYVSCGVKQLVFIVTPNPITTLAAVAMTLSAAVASAKCPLSGISLAPGMARTDIEVQVATRLGIPLKYSVAANNLTGGQLQYRTADCVLAVVYKADAPARARRDSRVNSVADNARNV